MHIVLVEDDEVIRETTQIALERFGYTVTGFADGRDGYEFVANNGADVVLLDLMLPTMNGASITRAIRERSAVPIIVISARSEPIDIVQALEAGADDYLTKPFDMQVLNARIRTVVRRFVSAGTGQMGFSPTTNHNFTQPVVERTESGHLSPNFDADSFPEVLGPTPGHMDPTGQQPATTSTKAATTQGPHSPVVPPRAGITNPAQLAPSGMPHDRGEVRIHNKLGELIVDTTRFTVLVNGEEIHLTPTELRILLLLTEEVGHVYSREKIAYTVWGYQWAGDSRVVDVHIQRLRKKIGPPMIETVRGFGYRFAG